MHVLHVISGIDPRQGGTTSALVALILAQLEAGLQVSLAATYADGFDSSAADTLRSRGADVTLIGPHGRLLARHPAIKPELRRLVASADVVHIHALWEEIQHQAAAVALQLGKPYLFTPHGMLDPWSLSQSRLKKQLYLTLRLRSDLNHAAAIHFTDETERDLARPLGLKPPAIVEGLIVDLSDFQPAPARGAFRAALPAALRDKPIALFMSRIHPKKGLDLLVPAFAATAGSIDAALVIAGPDDDGYRAAVEAMVREHRIEDRVFFPGMQRGSARAAALVDADVFVLPSYQENFGMVVIESLAVGTPVIVSDQVAIHRKIAESQSGEVVSTNVEKLAAALGRWLSDPALRRQSSDNARQMIAQQFDPSVQAKRWVEHYSALQR